MSAPRPPMLAADHIRELVRPYTTNEIVTQPFNGVDTPRVHTVHHASLLNQLRNATSGGTNLSNSDASRGIATSKPAAHLEALDVIARIDHQSRTLATNVDAGNITNLEDRLLAIAGKVGDEIHPRIRSWWAAARLVTHHDAPAMRPHGVPCPECWEQDTIRIRLEDDLAVCTHCGMVWDRTGDTTHGFLLALGDYVRWCTDHEITKPRHWATDAEGYPIECVECLEFRENYALHKVTKKAQETAAEQLTLTRHAQGA